MIYSQPSGGVLRVHNDDYFNNPSGSWLVDVNGVAVLPQINLDNRGDEPGYISLMSNVFRECTETVRQFGDTSADVEAVWNNEEQGGYEEGYIATRPFFFSHAYQPIDRVPVKIFLHAASGTSGGTTVSSTPRISTSLSESQNILNLAFVPILVNLDGLCVPSDAYSVDSPWQVRNTYTSSSPLGTTFKETEWEICVPLSTTKHPFLIVGGMFVAASMGTGTQPNFITSDSGRFFGVKNGIVEVTVSGCVVASQPMVDYPYNADVWESVPFWASNNFAELALYGDLFDARVQVQQL